MTIRTDDDVMHHIRANSPLNQVRAVLSGVLGEAEQAEAQRRPPSPVERRKAEFRAVERILAKAVEVGIVAQR